MITKINDKPNNMFYSPTTGGFYEESVEGSVEITFEEYSNLFQLHAAGHVIRTGPDGKPEAVPEELLLTLAERIKLKVYQLLYEMSARGAEPILFNGNMFKAEDEQLTLYTRLLAPGSLPADFRLRSIANVNIPMTRDELQGLAMAILERNQAIFWHYQSLKSLCNAATSTDELSAITWESV